MCCRGWGWEEGLGKKEQAYRVQIFYKGQLAMVGVVT